MKEGREQREIQTEITEIRAARKKKRLDREAGIAKRKAIREGKKPKIERAVFPKLKAAPDTKEENWLDKLNEDSLPENRPIFQNGSTPGTAHHSVTKTTTKGIAVWYSICSMHMIHDEECHICQSGSWKYYSDPEKENSEKDESIPVKGFFNLEKAQ